MIDRYQWRGGHEAMLRFGPDTGPVVIAALPLFEEANRTRAFTVTMLRALAARGVGGVLPDLPGQGESLAPLEKVGLLDMRDAYQALSEQLERRSMFGVGIRSGALVDTGALLDGRWHLASQDGPTLLRELKRLKAAGLANGETLGAEWWVADDPVEVGGNRIGTQMLAALHACLPMAASDSGSLRIVRLDNDPRPADRKLAGRPLWRSAEPDNDPLLAEALAEDIADWIRTCVG